MTKHHHRMCLAASLCTGRFARHIALVVGVVGASTMVACAAEPTATPMPPAEVPAASAMGAAAGAPTMNEDEQVIDFLRRLKRVIDENLLDQPQRMEEVFGFRITGWRDRKEDAEFSRARDRSLQGSFGGLSADWMKMERRPNDWTERLSLSTVWSSQLFPGISVKNLIQVFGEKFDVIPPQDAHKLSGDVVVYTSTIGSKKTEVRFRVHNIKTIPNRQVVSQVEVVHRSK